MSSSADTIRSLVFDSRREEVASRATTDNLDCTHHDFDGEKEITKYVDVVEASLRLGQGTYAGTVIQGGIPPH